MSDKKDIIPLEDVLIRLESHKQQFKDQLEKEEQLERVETVDSIKNDIRGIKQSTELKKNQFINEIKTGLGEKVKNNPNGIKIIKKKWYQKVGIFIKNIFTRF